jgi:hypothetical protein
MVVGGVVPVTCLPTVHSKRQQRPTRGVDMDAAPGQDEIGGTTPTMPKIATARRLLELHRAVGIPRNDFCSWCLNRWPCGDVRWSTAVLERAGQTSA